MNFQPLGVVGAFPGGPATIRVVNNHADLGYYREVTQGGSPNTAQALPLALPVLRAYGDTQSPYLALLQVDRASSCRTLVVRHTQAQQFTAALTSAADWVSIYESAPQQFRASVWSLDGGYAQAIYDMSAQPVLPGSNFPGCLVSFSDLEVLVPAPPLPVRVVIPYSRIAGDCSVALGGLNTIQLGLHQILADGTRSAVGSPTRRVGPSDGGFVSAELSQANVVTLRHHSDLGVVERQFNITGTGASPTLEVIDVAGNTIALWANAATVQVSNGGGPLFQFAPTSTGDRLVLVNPTDGWALDVTGRALRVTRGDQLAVTAVEGTTAGTRLFVLVAMEQANLLDVIWVNEATGTVLP